ncbi:hypothetical protein L596_005141 [Steinernema carpocapsae]|uniref:Plastocyanin-like domain-containing protein n=1 Tax=Steinernema carpocapsae TaxID=34508 RepID=A0A4U8UZM6_STECR|nr:hypothetical protein L596_005141 [Steinernema carpocapsae]
MSRLRVLQLLSLLLFLESGFCWKKYADPIRLADANKYGIYEFNLELKHKLTMSHEKKFHHLDVLDYRPREKSFYKRSSNQLHPCDESSIFVRDALNSHANTNDLDDVLIMHGQHQRVVTINGVSPGKTLVVPHNAEVIMRVKNRLLLEGVTLHLHGVDKKFAWFTDGVAFVQQCPISVNSNFAYRFLADTPGTHWYHGHLMSDRGDGLLGGFIIIKDNETYPNPFITNGPRFHFGKIRQYYALLQDWPVPTSAESWYNHVGETMKWLYGFDNNNGTCWTPTRIADGSNLGGAVPINAILVNDKGWHSQDDIRSIPSSLPLETFRIKKEEEIIIRIVNGGVAQELMVTTEEHEMYIIAADGVEIKPQKVDSLIVFSGERYDVMIKGMKNPNRKVYPILIETIDTVRWDWGVNKPTVTLAKLEYEDVTHDETDQGADYNHSNCKADKQCVVANCPFEDFPKGSVFSCCGVHAVDLESAEEVDKEVTAQKIFTDNEYEEHFINMHFDSHVDGFMFKLPRGVPYFYDNGTNMAEVADTCDYSKCTAATTQAAPASGI